MDDYNYEQMEIDVRLESEKDLKTNVGKVIKFFYDKRRMEAEESGWPLKSVESKHEGYGIAAEAYSKIGAKVKSLKSGMETYLKLLQVKGEDCVSICGDIYSQALELAMEAIGMAADATRILNDLYYGYDSRTPIEQAIADMNAQNAQEGAEFEEAEESQGGEENGDGEPQEEIELYDPEDEPEEN